jgi:CDGSH-type Zn-finger protein/truncated hemoglobin YjbI
MMTTDLERQLGQLYQSIESCAGVLAERDDDQSRALVERLANGALRPLRAVVDDAVEATRDEPTDLRSELNAVARDATEVFARHATCTELGEAVAALQDIALILADDEHSSALVEEWHNLLVDVVPTVQAVRRGPYLVTNARGLFDWLGQSIPLRPQVALCRCGQSATKPTCDGTHARTDFTDDKDPGRVPDHRQTYVGEQITIFDNRGTCQHAGYCTDRLATVFRVHDEPFVVPSGGRMDEIIRAVRDCPSGALSYAIDGVEARDDVDYHNTRTAQVEVTKDGPYRVTGAIRLLDANGDRVARNQGASIEHYALCRCGHSQNKPFCSGMHYYVNFRDPIADPDRVPTISEWAGGLPALTRMTRLFYEKYVPQDALLAPLFATMSPDHPQRVAKWLAEVFGGPANYSNEYGGYPRMLSQHLGKGLTEEQRTRWVELLLASARDARLPNDAEFRSSFEAYIEWGSRLAVENSQTDARPPEHMPMPHWDWNTAAGPPGSRISALAPAPDDTHEVQLPSGDEPVTFEPHIKSLFRDRDRASMLFAFDLWSYDDVSGHADVILERVRNGTMPCDGRWPQSYVDVFDRWTTSGKPR